MGDHEDDERRERPKRGVERSAGAGQVARSLAKLDLSSMTGHSEVLRAANAFSRQVSPFTGLLQDAERARKLTAGLSVLDADRRDVLGTAIVASDVTKHLGLDRKPFLDHVTRSISTVVAGQLSLTAKLEFPRFGGHGWAFGILVFDVLIGGGEPRSGERRTVLSESAGLVVGG